MEWIISDKPVPYPDAMAQMEARVNAIIAGQATEAIWLLEHPALYTAGTSAKHADLLDPDRFPVFDTKRGGQFTYHGPGQRVVYVMLNLNNRGRDVRAYVTRLENWIIATLAEFNIRGRVHKDRVGVWVQREQSTSEDKIAAIGVRLRKWVAFHGISINVDPDLTHFDGIVPCGITEHGVTSMVDQGLPVTMGDLDLALRKTFPKIFPNQPPV